MCLWPLLLLQGLLLLYGAYLAGLTNHVSSPPVNQSLTIMVGVNLLLLTAGLLFVVTRYLHSWPNLVFGLTSGGIFVCTTTVNCCVFLPQVGSEDLAGFFPVWDGSFHFLLTLYGGQKRAWALSGPP